MIFKIMYFRGKYTSILLKLQFLIVDFRLYVEILYVLIIDISAMFNKTMIHWIFFMKDQHQTHL